MTRLPALVLTIVAVLAAAPTAASASGLLFAQGVRSGELRGDGKGGYVLSVRPSGRTTAFTDRPARRVSSIDPRSLVRRWASYGFADNPPNAALVVDDAPRNANVFALTLRRPRVLSGGRLAFDARPLRGEAGALADQLRGADRLRATRFAAGSLFVDDAGLPSSVPLQFAIEIDNQNNASSLRFGLTLKGATFAQAGGAPIITAFPGTPFLTTPTFSPTQLGWTVQYSGQGPNVITMLFTATIKPTASSVSATFLGTAGGTLTVTSAKVLGSGEDGLPISIDLD